MTFFRTYFLSSIMQYQPLSGQMAHLNHFDRFMSVRTVRLTSTTLLIQRIIVLSVVSAQVLTLSSQNIKIGFFKFSWDQKLYLLKEKSLNWNTIWKAAGKPHVGPIAPTKSDKFAYNLRIRQGSTQRNFPFLTNYMKISLINLEMIFGTAGFRNLVNK